MRRTWWAAAALALVAGCGAGDDTEGVAVDDPAGVEQAEGVASETPEGVPMNGEWAREYETPEDILAELRAAGVECLTEDESMETMVAERMLFCYTNETRDDGYTINVYASGQQQGEAHVHFSEDTSWAGTTFVWGSGWSVAVPQGSDGSGVVGALGGEAVTF